MPGRVGLEFQFSQPRRQTAMRPDDESPMRILVMGDFSGRASCSNEDAADLATRPLIPVDIDNFDKVFSRMAPNLRLQLGHAAAALPIAFSQLDDFHPDKLYGRLSLFAALRDTRARLQNPATFAATAASLQPANNVSIPSSQPLTVTTNPVVAEDTAATVERLLGKRVEQAATPNANAASGAGIDAFIRQVIAPHIVPATSPEQEQYVTSVEVAIGEQMRAILHHPAYQALESAWRGIYWLISEINFGEQLQLYLLDVTHEELQMASRSNESEPENAALCRVLTAHSEAHDDVPWSLLLGNYTFSAGERDVELLAWLGAIASHAGGPFLAGAETSVFGCRSVVDTPDPRDWQVADPATAQRWQALRRSAIAPWLGLVSPRMLLRQPYGKKSDVINSFAFEELTALPAHEGYLWGNAALGAALLIGRAFLEQSWAMQPGDEQNIEGLPSYVSEFKGEKILQACAEVYLSDRAGEAILAAGLMPLVSLKNQNAVRMIRFQSLADPLQMLAGPWC